MGHAMLTPRTIKEVCGVGTVTGKGGWLGRSQGGAPSSESRGGPARFDEGRLWSGHGGEWSVGVRQVGGEKRQFPNSLWHQLRQTKERASKPRPRFIACVATFCSHPTGVDKTVLSGLLRPLSDSYPNH